MKLYKFYADWCGPCKQLAPVIEELKEQYTDVEFKNINVEKKPDLSIKMQVQAVPTVIIEKDGEIISTIMGLNNKDVYENILKSN